VQSFQRHYPGGAAHVEPYSVQLSGALSPTQKLVKR
jgi:hypothetical protein